MAKQSQRPSQGPTPNQTQPAPDSKSNEEQAKTETPSEPKQESAQPESPAVPKAYIPAKFHKFAKGKI